MLWLLQVVPDVGEIRSVVGDPLAVLIILSLAVVGLIVGGIRGWYVWGPAHRAQVSGIEKERDEWRELFWQTFGLTVSTTDVAAGAVRRGK